MVRDVQALVCVHPADDKFAVVLRYSHRHHRDKRDPEFINKSSKVFESLAFIKKINDERVRIYNTGVRFGSFSLCVRIVVASLFH